MSNRESKIVIFKAALCCGFAIALRALFLVIRRCDFSRIILSLREALASWQSNMSNTNTFDCFALLAMTHPLPPEHREGENGAVPNRAHRVRPIPRLQAPHKSKALPHTICSPAKVVGGVQFHAFGARGGAAAQMWSEDTKMRLVPIDKECEK